MIIKDAWENPIGLEDSESFTESLNSRNILLSIISVCGSWRHTALGHPALWRHVVIAHDCPHPFTIVPLFLEHGSEVYVHPGYPDMTTPLSLIPAVNRNVSRFGPAPAPIYLENLRILHVTGCMAFFSAIARLYAFHFLTTLHLEEIGLHFPYTILDSCIALSDLRLSFATAVLPELIALESKSFPPHLLTHLTIAFVKNHNISPLLAYFHGITTLTYFHLNITGLNIERVSPREWARLSGFLGHQTSFKHWR